MNSSRNFENRSRRLRRAHKRGRLALVAVLFAAVCAGAFLLLGRRAPMPPATRVALSAATPAPESPTPAPRPWTTGQIGNLRTELESAFAPAISGASHWSFCVMDARGHVLYAVNARTGVEPASVAKLVVASAALDLLGTNYRYHTLLAAPVEPQSGTLDGNLWLIGSGDPSLRSTDLAVAARRLRDAGLQRIDGGVMVDASAFSGPEINPLWNPDDANEDFQAPVSAISLDEDTIEFDVRGTTPGAPAAVRENPWSGVLSASGDVTTVAVEDDPDVIVAALATPNHFALSGSIPENDFEQTWVPVHGIARYAGAVMTQLLREHGIKIARAPETGVAPVSRIAFWDHPSASLRALERHMLYLSDNHYADQLLRTLGLVVGGVGDDAHGLAVERADLHRRGLPTDGMYLVDGSGLAEKNRLASLTLASILVDALVAPKERGFYDLLPQGGRSGTLKDYDFVSALGRVRAKTGHLTGAASLAGYVVSRRHGIVAFAFMINGSPGDPDSAMVSAVDRLSEF